MVISLLSFPKVDKQIVNLWHEMFISARLGNKKIDFNDNFESQNEHLIDAIWVELATLGVIIFNCVIVSSFWAQNHMICLSFQISSICFVNKKWVYGPDFLLFEPLLILK